MSEYGYDFGSDWQMAKTLFEVATDKKKPGKKFLGAFKLSSGMEKACKELTRAIESPTPEKLKKAEKDFEKTAADYVKVLRKAAEEDGASDKYKFEISKLEAAIEKIRKDFNTAKEKEVEDAMMLPFAEIVPQKIVEGLTKAAFPTNPAIQAFFTKPQFGVSGVDGKTKIPDLAKYQQDAKNALKNYVLAMKAMKDQAKKKMWKKEAWEFAKERFDDAIVAVATDGYQGAVAYWKNAQETAFREAGVSHPEQRKWMEGGPLTPVLQQINNAIQEEMPRLFDLAAACKKQIEQLRGEK
jgi:hypothetical protein